MDDDEKVGDDKRVLRDKICRMENSRYLAGLLRGYRPTSSVNFSSETVASLVASVRSGPRFLPDRSAALRSRLVLRA